MGSSVCIDPLSPPVSLLFLPRDRTEGSITGSQLLRAMCTTVEWLLVTTGGETGQQDGPLVHVLWIPAQHATV